MPPYDTIIIDDEPDAGQLLGNLLKEFSSFTVTEIFSDARKGLDAAILKQPPVIFVDIEMPEISGIEFLKQINKLSPYTKVVFVTAYEQYAMEAIHHDAFDFLCKPVSKSDLKRVVYKIIAALNQGPIQTSGTDLTNHPRLLLKTMEGHHYIPIEQILFLEADGNYTCLQLADNRRLISSINMGKIHEQLPKEDFIRISRKRVINKKHLSFMNFCKNYCIITHKDQEYKLEVSMKMRDLKRDLM